MKCDAVQIPVLCEAGTERKFFVGAVQARGVCVHFALTRGAQEPTLNIQDRRLLKEERISSVSGGAIT